LPTPTSAAGDQTKKSTRPFKAVSFSLGEVSALYSESFGHFKDEVYAQAKPVTKISGNKKKRTVPKHYSSPEPSSSSEQSLPKGKDAAYLEKRRKNNEAAKRSRDARRAKEDELALWKAFLEQENQRLRYELIHLKKCGIQIVAGSCVCKPLLVHRDLQQ
jgi:bZIP factor